MLKAFDLESNRSVKEFNLSDPGEILNKARDIVINEFAKSDQEVADGMDIALCAIEDNKVEFAGANNPLWVVRHHELLEVKANRQPVGVHAKMVPFETQEFILEDNDLLYIFSDGYADQFGGSQSKKFFKKNLKSKLISIAELPIDQQLEKLYACFEEWKGDHEQIDDVCILGLRYKE